MKKISIIIPMYNVEQYLEKCLSSVLIQNLNENEFEVIMVDDESPDSSLLIAKNMAKKYNFIKIISQKNKGLGGARNTGIKAAESKYLLFLDADDWLLPNVLPELISLSETHNLDVLEFGANLVLSKNNVLYSITNNSNEVLNGIDYYFKIKYSSSACNKLYSKKFLIENDLFFLEKVYGEDFEFNTRCFYLIKRIKATNKICVEFLQTPNSITRNKSKKIKDKYLSDFIIALNSINAFKQKKITDTKYFNERMTLINIDAFYMMFKNGYSYNDMKKYKHILIENNIFKINDNVSDSKKNLFRKVMLKNFYLFKISQLFIKTQTSPS